MDQQHIEYVYRTQLITIVIVGDKQGTAGHGTTYVTLESLPQGGAPGPQYHHKPYSEDSSPPYPYREDLNYYPKEEGAVVYMRADPTMGHGKGYQDMLPQQYDHQAQQQVCN